MLGVFVAAGRAQQSPIATTSAMLEDYIDAVRAQAELGPIVNLRFATSYVMGSASEILAYGDAVKLEKEPEVTGF